MAEEMGMPDGMTEEQIDAMEDAAGSAATINMGGGGGGAQGPGSNKYAGGTGGPGIVIVSYPYPS